MSDEDKLIFGCDNFPRLVAVEVQTDSEASFARLYTRVGTELRESTDLFTPFLIAQSHALLKGCPISMEQQELTGDAPLKILVSFKNWNDWTLALDWLKRETGYAPGRPDAPYVAINDPVQQYLLLSGRTLFRDMEFED